MARTVRLCAPIRIALLNFEQNAKLPCEGAERKPESAYMDAWMYGYPPPSPPIGILASIVRVRTDERNVRDPALTGRRREGMEGRKEGKGRPEGMGKRGCEEGT